MEVLIVGVWSNSSTVATKSYIVMTVDVRATHNARSFFITKTEKVATISMETNIALGLFVNRTQLLFRVMGAPPCHNNSRKEEQFNVNNIFSICLLMKTLQSTGKTFLLVPKGKHSGKDELVTSSKDAVKGKVLACCNERSSWWHVSICSLLHCSKMCQTFYYLEFSMQFTQGNPSSTAPAD